MIRINLLPFRAARKKENVRRQVGVFFLVLLLTIVALIGVHIVLAGRVKSVENKITDVNTRLVEAEKRAARAREIESTLNILDKQLTIIEMLKANREQAVRLIDNLTRWILPKRMWISELKQKEVSSGSTKKKKGKGKGKKKAEKVTITQELTLKGFAEDSATVADFMRNLENSGEFESVELAHVDAFRGDSQSPFSDKDFKIFTIVCKKVPYTAEMADTK